jgi:hypothetical protein
MMLNAPLALELANAEIHERLRQAARQALAHELSAASRSAASGSAASRLAASGSADRVRLATLARSALAAGLRRLAVRLDPTLDCQPNLAIPSSR